MMRSMFSGISGLRVHQTKMDVIANNIANVNTAGYKSSRITFNEVFSQTLSSASAANAATGRGGVNAMQIGLGANVSSIDMLMTPGASQRTDNPYDLMIEGEGFFVVTDASGTYFSRAGAFRLDNDGYLVNSAGMQLNGWQAQPGVVPGTETIQKTGVKPIQISAEDEQIGAEVTTLVNFEGNLNALKDPVKDSTISFFDSLGNKYVIDVQFKYNDTDKDWQVLIGNYMYPEGDKSKGVYIGGSFASAAIAGGTGTYGGLNPYNFTITPAATPTSPVPQATLTSIGKIKFDDSGRLVGDSTASPTYMTGIEFKIDIPATGSPLSPDARFSVPMTTTFYKMTQNAGSTNAMADTVDGRKPGTLVGVSIGTDGIITGRYSNGQTRKLWQIALAQFKNPAGLERAGSNLYVSTPNSGEFDGVGVEAGAGTRFLAGVLEMANVDLAAEFTEMITAQRGFQANSRVITTSDEMLQELVNLKR